MWQVFLYSRNSREYPIQNINQRTSPIKLYKGITASRATSACIYLKCDTQVVEDTVRFDLKHLLYEEREYRKFVE